MILAANTAVSLRRLFFLAQFVATLLLVHSFQLPITFQGWVGCVSHFEAQQILDMKSSALVKPIECALSIDLSYSTINVYLDDKGLYKAADKDKLLASWDELEGIVDKKNRCYALYDDGAMPMHISTLGKKTGIPASLCPPLARAGAPTMVLGGFTMHRIAGDDVNPTVDTTAKLSSVSIGPYCRVLDTCMGLGYTAIGAGRLIAKSSGFTGLVTTIEYDEASVEMCGYNPWSQQLFDGSLPIDIRTGDSCEIVKEFEDSSFNVVIHDPPARALCKTDLYGLSFYSQLHRILKKNGRGTLFHYIGNPSSKESGRLYSGITKRLQEAGFNNIKKSPRAFGVVAST